MSNSNECAFPVPETGINFHDGLTKREYFASMAMQGLLCADQKRGRVVIAENAVAQADALLAALDKTVSE